MHNRTYSQVLGHLGAAWVAVLLSTFLHKARSFYFRQLCGGELQSKLISLGLTPSSSLVILPISTLYPCDLRRFCIRELFTVTLLSFFFKRSKSHSVTLCCWKSRWELVTDVTFELVLTVRTLGIPYLVSILLTFPSQPTPAHLKCRIIYSPMAHSQTGILKWRRLYFFRGLLCGFDRVYGLLWVSWVFQTHTMFKHIYLHFIE